MANHYIRDGGTGDGSDWTNALDDLPSTFVRGDTYYVADGSYGGHTFNTTLDGTNVIYIKKATEGAHGTDTGWSSAYGDGQAVFTGVIDLTSANSSYLDIDGVTGSGRTGHGFKFTGLGLTALVNFWNDAAHTNYAFRHCEFATAEDQNAPGATAEMHMFRLWRVHEFTIEYCWIHDVETTHFQIVSSCQNFTMQYCVVEKRHTVSTVHGELMMLWGWDNPAGIVLRYNIFADCYGSGLVYFDNADGITGAEIYGNIFYQSSSRYYTSNGLLGGGSSHVYSQIKIYNNTFVDAYDSGGGFSQYGVYIPGGASCGNEAYNNVCINTGGISLSNGTKDYNLYDNSGQAAADAGNGQYYSGGTGLFTDYSGDDYTLSENTDAGVDLGATYDEDMLGNPRTTWSRGAYEYGVAATPASCGVFRMVM